MFLHVIKAPSNKVERLYASVGVCLYNCLWTVKISKFSIITDRMLPGKRSRHCYIIAGNILEEYTCTVAILYIIIHNYYIALSRASAHRYLELTQEKQGVGIYTEDPTFQYCWVNSWEIPYYWAPFLPGTLWRQATLLQFICWLSGHIWTSLTIASVSHVWLSLEGMWLFYQRSLVYHWEVAQMTAWVIFVGSTALTYLGQECQGCCGSILTVCCITTLPLNLTSLSLLLFGLPFLNTFRLFTTLNSCIRKMLPKSFLIRSVQFS